jgi:hypothetical protein
MGKINYDDIKPGMIVVSDVTDRTGRVLLSAGSEITLKHLRIFKMWGVTEADIVGVEKKDVDAWAAAQYDPVLLHEAENELAAIFCQTDRSDPVVAELFRLSTLRRVRGRVCERGDDE